MFMKRIAFVLLLLIALPAAAHECWIACQKYVLAVGEVLRISLHVGEGYEPERWKGNIKWFKHYAGKKTVELLPKLDTATSSLAYTTQTEGTQLIALQSYAKFIRLEADKFNAYLLEDGLADITEWRKKNGQTDKEATEMYERCNKALFQVGKQFTNAYKQKIGLPLEIVLLQNPYQQPEKLQAQLLFQGKPLPNHLFKVWHREAGKTILADMQTDAKGMVQFDLKKKGNYMLSAVKMIPHDKPSEAQWHSYWANYTFGSE
jgi:uncharacterized GH25 family protein